MLVQRAGWTKQPRNLAVLQDLSMFLIYFFAWSNGPSCFLENLYIFVVYKIFWDFLLEPSDHLWFLSNLPLFWWQSLDKLVQARQNWKLWLGGAVKLEDLIGQNWLESLFFIWTLEDNNLASTDWIYAILVLLESP